MQAHDIDSAKVTKCIADSFVNKGSATDETNTKLDAEIADRKELALLTLPTAIVNGRELRGQTQFGTTMEQNVARAVCQGFQTVPVECDRILNPHGRSGAGEDDGKLGVVRFKATLAYKPTGTGSNRVLTPADYEDNARLQHRFLSALALKTGADPMALSFSDATETTEGDEGGGKVVPGSITVGVTVSNLECGHGTGKESVTDALKKISDCGEDLGDEGGEDAAEQELEAIRTFNIHSGGAEVVEVTVSKVTIDDTLCKAPPSDQDDGGAGTYDPAADQNDPGRFGPGGQGGGSGGGSGTTAGGADGGSTGGYTGGSMAGMFFGGMITVIVLGGGLVVWQRRRAAMREGGGDMFSSTWRPSAGAVTEAEYNEL